MIEVHVETEEVVTVEKAEFRAIFAKKEGRFKGMVVYEEGRGWILRLSGTTGANGYHDSLRSCLEAAKACKYDFFVEST